MIALDTNILVRMIVADDPDQTGRARKLLESSAVLVSATVVLECEWVLRSAYGFKPNAIATAITKLLGLPQVSLIEPAVVHAALAGYRLGLDFADAMHLAGSGEAESFATFDRSLLKRAGTMPGVIPVIEPQS